MTALPSVAIVILNWNGKPYLEKFLPSVLASGYGNLRIIVADNASSDDSISFLEEAYPIVEIIRLKENYGFAKGYNEALEQVDATYLVLLNSDVEVTSGWLDPLVSFMEDHPVIAAVQPKILSYQNKQQFEYAGAAGGWIDQFGYAFSRGRIFEHCETDHGQYNHPQQIFWASGAAFFIRKESFMAAGGFDAYFFAHMEEIDLCWRLQLMGLQLWCIPDAVVYHVGGGTLPKGNSRKTFLNFRNNQIMMAKNLPLREKWWKIPFRLMLDQAAALRALLGGDAGYFFAVARAHIAFFYWVFAGPSEKIQYRRRPIQKLPGVFNGNIAFEYFLHKKKTFSVLVTNQAIGEMEQLQHKK